VPVWYLGRPGYQVVRTRRTLTGKGPAPVAANVARPAAGIAAPRPSNLPAE
jgi:nitrate reductase gamma subunit